jgi:lipid A 3-O-deacylase
VVLAVVVLCALRGIPAAQAADLGSSVPVPQTVVVEPPDRANTFEARFGAFYHDPGFDEARPRTIDVNAELVGPRLPIPVDGWAKMFVPRPMVGVMANTGGKTSFAYISAVWTFQWNNFFFEPIFGGAVHNGYLDNPPPGRLALGCNPLFHTGLSLGYYITDHWAVMGTWQHISNANACERNVGLNTYGLRLGYSF